MHHSAAHSSPSTAPLLSCLTSCAQIRQVPQLLLADRCANPAATDGMPRRDYVCVFVTSRDDVCNPTALTRNSLSRLIPMAARTVRSNHAKVVRLVSSNHAKVARMVSSNHAKAARMVSSNHAKRLKTRGNTQRAARQTRCTPSFRLGSIIDNIRAIH